MKVNQFFKKWERVRKDLLSTIEKFTDEELSFTPFESSMSAGQIMLHIGDAEEGWFQYVAAREMDKWPTYDLEDYPTTESIKAQLDIIHTRTEEFLEPFELEDLDRVYTMPNTDYRFSLGWIIWHVMEHEIHHRGELSLILGILGREGLEV